MRLVSKILIVGYLMIGAFFTVKAQDLQADNMLLFQRPCGGWFKQLRGKAFSYNQSFSDNDKAEISREAQQNIATIDNEATSKEIRYLVKIYKTVPNPKYLAAAENGIRYLLKAQYENGGFPQYYPDHGLYRNEITYNDNAMINALTILKDVADKRNGFDIVASDLVTPAADAVTKGISCILKTQIVVDGKLTGWCQQYNEKTLLPAKARSYELPSISGAETVGIIRFLMNLSSPSQEVKNAVDAGVQWLKKVEITGYNVASFNAPGTPKGTDKRVVKDANSVLWARYYEIGTNRPFFCNRDGKKVYEFSAVDYERRNGYSWYGRWPQKLIEKDFPEWLAKQKG